MLPEMVESVADTRSVSFVHVKPMAESLGIDWADIDPEYEFAMEERYAELEGMMAARGVRTARRCVAASPTRHRLGRDRAPPHARRSRIFHGEGSIGRTVASGAVLPAEERPGSKDRLPGNAWARTSVTDRATENRPPRRSRRGKGETVG